MQTLNHQVAVYMAEEALRRYNVALGQGQPLLAWTALKEVSYQIMMNTRSQDVFPILAHGWDSGIIGIALNVGSIENQAFFNELVARSLSPDLHDVKRALKKAKSKVDWHAFECLIKIARDNIRQLTYFVLNLDDLVSGKMPAIKIMCRNMEIKEYVDILITWVMDDGNDRMRRDEDLLFECMVLVGDGWREHTDKYIAICESILTWNMAKPQYMYWKMDTGMFRIFGRLFNYGVLHVRFQTAQIDHFIKLVLQIGDDRPGFGVRHPLGPYFDAYEAHTILNMLSVDAAAGRLLTDENYLYQAIRSGTRVHVDLLALLFTRFGYDDDILGGLLDYVIRVRSGFRYCDCLIDMLLHYYSGKLMPTWNFSLYYIASLGSIKLMELVMRRAVRGRTGLAR